MAELSRLASTPRMWGAEVRVARVAEKQSGIVTRTQLIECGVGTATVSRCAQAGYLHRIHQGVYSVGHCALSVHGHLVAALFYAGPGAALSHATAAWWWRLIESRPRRVDVSIRGRLVSVGAVRIHQQRRFERVRHRGLPVTTVARTLLDFASVAPLERVRRAVAEADYLRLLDLQAIDRLLGRGRAGSATLRKALERHRPEYTRTLSPLEDRFLDLCERHGFHFPR